MESLGEYLRRQREIKGLSLKEISDRTKIGINYLMNIEENRFDKIPGEVFTKGFLRIYASSIGLRAEEVIEKYDLQYKVAEKEVVVHEDTVQKVKEDRHLRIPLWIWIIPILLIAVFLLKGLPRKIGHPPVPSKEINKLNKPEPSSIPSPDTPQELTLSIEALEETWVKILIDGKDVKEVLLKGGDSVTINARKNFGLTVGNAGGIKINFNGKELKTLGPRGKVIRNLVLSREEKSLSPVINTPSPSPSPLRGED